jgi:hypothetical protein
MTGERAAVGAVRQALLGLPEGWRVLDHVVIGPAGVFVVDGLRWPGTITAHDGELRQDGESRHAVVRAAQQAGEDVRRDLPRLDPRLVQPVLCFVGPTPGRARIGGVVVCTAETVVPELLSFPALLDPREVDGLAEQLRGHPVTTGGPTGAAAGRPPAWGARHRSGRRPWLLAGVAIGLAGAAAVVLALVVGLGPDSADDDPSGDVGDGSHQPGDHRPDGASTPGGRGGG